MRGMYALLFVQFCMFATMSAQNSNPFELRWKEGGDSLYAYEEAAEGMALRDAVSDSSAHSTETDVQPPAASAQDEDLEPAVALKDTVATRPQEDTSGLVSAVPGDEPGEALPEEDIGPGITDDTESRELASPLILLLLFGLVFVLLTWAVNLTPGLVRKIYRAAFNENFSALLMREHKFASTQYLYYLVYIVFFINGGIFLYFLSRYSGWRFGYEQSPLIVFIGFVCFVYLIRHVVLTIIGITFPVAQEVTHFSFNIILYNILLGLALIPINLFLAFGPSATHSWMIILGLVAIGLFYLLRQARGIMIGGHLISNNVFQFFVYLCTIEILPVLVLLKFFHN